MIYSVGHYSQLILLFMRQMRKPDLPKLGMHQGHSDKTLPLSDVDSVNSG